MIRFHLPGHGYHAVWTCSGTKDGTSCPPYVIHEKYIDRAVREAFEQLDETELTEQASKRGLRSKVAKTVLDWRRKHPHIKRIEYIFLDTLVEKITFNKWSEAVVVWKHGKKSRVPVRYAKPSETPNVEVIHTAEGFMANGEPIDCGEVVLRCVERIKASCLKARERNKYGRPNDVRAATKQSTSTAQGRTEI